MCAAICVPGEQREITDIAQVPSVMMQVISEKITYAGCSKCKKAYNDQAPNCDCGEDSVHHWKARVLLTDGSAQVEAVVFDALADLAEAVMDCEEAGSKEANRDPNTYAEDSGKVDQFLAVFAALPLTVRITFDNRNFKEGLEMTVRVIQPTIDTAPKGVRHPLTVIPCFKSDSSPCPPVALATTSFLPGVGLSLVPTGSVPSFRALLQFTEKPQGLKRDADGITLRVNRKCVCALSPDDDKTIFMAVQNGPLEVTSRLLQFEKGDLAHAVVAWRSKDVLTILCAHKIPTDATLTFKAFFSERGTVARRGVRTR